MKKVVALASVLFLAVLAFAAVKPAAASTKTHEMTVTVVSVDLEGKKITFKDDTGAENTGNVLPPAEKSLKTVKAGEKVVLTCQDKENGDHEGVSAIKPAKEKAAKAPKN